MNELEHFFRLPEIGYLKHKTLPENTVDFVVARLRLFADIGQPFIICGISEAEEIWKKLLRKRKKFKKSINKEQNTVVIWRIK
jgi:hypothetical protein